MENMNKKAYISVLFSIAVIIIIIIFGCFHHTDRPVETVAKRIALENFPEYDLAIEYYNAYNYKSAVSQFNEALEHADRQERGAAEYWIKGMIGSCYTLTGDIDTAEPYILEAVEGIEKVGQSFYLSRIYELAGNYYRHASVYDKAVEYYTRSLVYAEGEGVFRANLGLAEAYRESGRSKKALEYYETAISEGEERQAVGCLTTAYMSLGTFWFRERNMDKAELCFKQSRRYAETAWGRNSVEVAQSCQLLAQVCESKREYDSAYSYWRKAMDIYKKQDARYSYNTDVAELYASMGLYHVYFKNYRAALGLLKKSYHVVRGKMEQDTELAYFYENTLSLSIKALYDRSAGKEAEFEVWFNENFERGNGSCPPVETGSLSILPEGRISILSPWNRGNLVPGYLPDDGALSG
ncbi:tetratricopeptide repeat protein [Clostridiaceae bacterium]|nr:tetratricopeptide repeat protein [Clostridiaceae bacterium]